MKLSIVQRTVAGFALMFLLMAILSSVSLFNARVLQGKVEQITEQSTPMVVASGDLITQLMRTNLLVSTFSEDTASDTQIESQFRQQKQRFFDTLENAQQNASGSTERQQLDRIYQASNRYFEQAQALLSLKNRLSVWLKNKMRWN